MGKNPNIDRINAMVAGASINANCRTVAEAKLRIAAISQLKKELGLVKKELVAAKHQIHASHENQKNHVGKGLTGAIIRSLSTPKAAGSINASAKNTLRNHELKVLQPYQDAETHLAQVLVSLDRLKLQIETWIVQQK